MLSKTRSLVAAQQHAARRVAAGRRFSVRLPVLGTVRLPPPDQLAFYGVLAGLAALELIDWPVAVAMGVGSAVVSRHLSDVEAREAELEEQVRAAPPTTPAATATAPAPAKKTAAKKAAAEKTAAKKTAAKQSPAKKTTAKKTAAKKTAATKTAAKRTAAKKASAGKIPAKKTAPRQAR